MANVTINGASFTYVPAIVVPQTGGGIVQFTDVSTTTAVESDVASGKKFFKADGSAGTGTASGGGGGAWYGINPVLLDSWTLNIKLSDTSYSTWTPSTTSKKVYNAEERDRISVGTGGALELPHTYIAIMRYHNKFAFTEGAASVSRYLQFAGVRYWYLGPYTGNTTAWVYGNDLTKIQLNVSFANLFEVAQDVPSSGTYGASIGISSALSYGIVFANSNPGLISTVKTGNEYFIRLCRPAVNVRAYNSKMPAASWAYVDAAKTTIKAEGFLYQVDTDVPFELSKECANILMNGL